MFLNACRWAQRHGHSKRKNPNQSTTKPTYTGGAESREKSLLSKIIEVTGKETFKVTTVVEEPLQVVQHQRWTAGKTAAKAKPSRKPQEERALSKVEQKTASYPNSGGPQSSNVITERSTVSAVEAEPPSRPEDVFADSKFSELGLCSSLAKHIEGRIFIPKMASLIETSNYL